MARAHSIIRYFDDLHLSLPETELSNNLRFEHVGSWWAHKGDENILFIQYEQMQADLPGVIRWVAAFLSLPVLSDELVARIASLSAFDVMKVDNTCNHSWSFSTRREGFPEFMRQGTVGKTWHAYLSTFLIGVISINNTYCWLLFRLANQMSCMCRGLAQLLQPRSAQRTGSTHGPRAFRPEHAVHIPPAWCPSNQRQLGSFNNRSV